MQRCAVSRIVMLTDQRWHAISPIVRDLEPCAVTLIFAKKDLRRTQVLGQAAHHIGFDTVCFAQPGQRAAQLQQERLILLEAHPLGGLGDQAQHPADTSIGLTHRGIRHIEVHRLAQSVAFYIKGAILGREGLASLTHTEQQRLEVMPQFAPVFLAWTPQCVGMLAANGRRIGVIVKRSKGLTPEQHELRLGRQ
ncbi:hypothetical protein D3C81_1131110 [compost metagenome]